MSTPLVHSPAEAALALRAETDRIRSGEATGYPTGLGPLDKHIPGLVRPTEICFFLARPGHGKSFALRQTARVNALRGAPFLTVECEMSVEDQEMREASFYTGEDSADILSGTADWDAVAAAADWRSGLPVYTVGYSRLKYDEIRTARRSKRIITVETISDAIDQLKAEGVNIEGVCIDYLQLIKPARQLGSVRQEIIEVVRDLKSLAQHHHVALFVGVQAKRDVDNRTPPIPRKGDGSESSEIEKAADYIICLTYFAAYYNVGEKIPGLDRFVSSDELFALVDKQRMGKPNVAAWLKFLPKYAVLFAEEDEWTPPYRARARVEEDDFHF